MASGVWSGMTPKRMTGLSAAKEGSTNDRRSRHIPVVTNFMAWRPWGKLMLYLLPTISAFADYSRVKKIFNKQNDLALLDRSDSLLYKCHMKHFARTLKVLSCKPSGWRFCSSVINS
jgi:hypothetical protein